LNILRVKYILSGMALILMLSISSAMTFADSPPIDSGDPFGAPPKGTSPNCGPEYRLKLNLVVSSKSEFMDILLHMERYVADDGIIKWITFDSFKTKGSAEVDMKALENAIRISNVSQRTMYSLDYTPYGCSPSQKFTIKITDDGHMSLYGCCGK